MIVREVFDNGLCLLTEAMPHVRSVSIGVWLTRGSRHEAVGQAGIAHFVEHMLFKGTTTRSAEDIAQAIDSIGGQLDAFTAKEYAGYYIKVLDEQLPRALDVLSDLVLNPAFRTDDIEREKSVVLEEIKMVEDTPDDLVHELFTKQFWPDHPLGRPILGSPPTVGSFMESELRDFFRQAYVAPHVIIAAAGNLEHPHIRELICRAFDALSPTGEAVKTDAPKVVSTLYLRNKELEQSHVCLGSRAYPQKHDDRYVSYVLNTILGGSMSSRLFQNVREKRGLAYAIVSGLNAYHDAGALTIYAGCATESVGEVVDLIVQELRGLAHAPVPSAELRRAQDHLKGSLMLSLENTSSRMSSLARQEIYFGRQFDLDETLAGIERVNAADLQRIAQELFLDGSLAATVLGPADSIDISAEQLGAGTAVLVE